ncbi:hypothetical protein Hanom_Chr04g00348421 [Helianthus anomalus]
MIPLMLCLRMLRLPPGEDVIARGAEHRFEGSGYVNVPNVKGFTRFGASKASICCLTRHMLKVADHPSASEPVQLRDVIEASNVWTLGLRKKDEDLSLVISKESKATGKKLVSLKGFGKSGEGSSNVNLEEVYVPDWKVTVGDSFKYPSVCEDVLTHFAPPIVRGSCSSIDDDLMISKMMMGACNLAALLLEGVSRFRKRMQEYEVFSKKRDEMKASMVALKEAEGYAEKEKALLFEDLSNFLPAQD